MKRKPYCWTGNWGDDEYGITTVNCKTKEEALELMKKEFDDKDIYNRPDFVIENVHESRCQHCRLCNYFSEDGICEECERVLQGKYYTIHTVELTLKQDA